MADLTRDSTVGSEALNPDRQRALYWLRRYRTVRNEWLVKKELMEDVTGLDMARYVEARLNRMHAALMAADAPWGRDARPLTIDEKQVAYRDALVNLTSVCAYLAVRSVANARWAVNEHVRNERLEAALQACWEEYEELMPDALCEQVKAALDVRVFTASAPDNGGSTAPPEVPT